MLRRFAPLIDDALDFYVPAFAWSVLLTPAAFAILASIVGS